MAIYDILTMEFERIAKENNLLNESVVIKAAPLTPDEAIGNPTDRDYPLVRGKERLMEANFQGGRGQAFTCLLYTSPSPRDKRQSRMPSSA